MIHKAHGKNVGKPLGLEGLAGENNHWGQSFAGGDNLGSGIRERFISLLRYSRTEDPVGAGLTLLSTTLVHIGDVGGFDALLGDVGFHEVEPVKVRSFAQMEGSDWP